MSVPAARRRHARTSSSALCLLPSPAALGADWAEPPGEHGGGHRSPLHLCPGGAAAALTTSCQQGLGGTQDAWSEPWCRGHLSWLGPPSRTVGKASAHHGCRAAATLSLPRTHHFSSSEPIRLCWSAGPHSPQAARPQSPRGPGLASRPDSPSTRPSFSPAPSRAARATGSTLTHHSPPLTGLTHLPGVSKPPLHRRGLCVTAEHVTPGTEVP
uniref:Uncharacterized protein n=1 Tax=Molossus molossus TaxID=27622 RepID=A0A7J8BBE2_MOLMO|nr:hypothetical protein HJG59_010472 [Molossus molossus]